MFGKKQSWPIENISTVLSLCQELKKVNEISVEIASVLPISEPGTLQIELWSVNTY
jgi:hypothetical protein